MTDQSTATAFVPGHVTGFFSAHRTGNPATTGSRGGGLTLSDGVRVRVVPSETTHVALGGERVEMEPVEHVLDAFDATARVTIESELPVGSGFGVSGAAALGAAYASNTVFDGERSENDLVELAHVAEVVAGTGLGDVVAQAHGGVPIRVEPGAPGHGVLDGVPTSSRVEYVTFGELSTAEVIEGDTTRLSRAGERALGELRERPTLRHLLRLSRRFAREAGLLVPEVETAIDAVSDAGGEAAMAMLGRSVFALDTGLSDAGYDPQVCETYPSGAHLER
ncbi:sugar kinase [Salinigranum rubrum]|uniref:Pantoate kinase n=1 Tax=Salinigranum rubrum TaxID=755307 RepID=A0A2I8VG75_9EURY|nr:pantoate kinase [Salinigranum rubrum]AUV80937.1 sugar kinase [Salinigranum rubrum]